MLKKIFTTFALLFWVSFLGANYTMAADTPPTPSALEETEIDTIASNVKAEIKICKQDEKEPPGELDIWGSIEAGKPIIMKVIVDSITSSAEAVPKINYTVKDKLEKEIEKEEDLDHWQLEIRGRKHHFFYRLPALNAGDRVEVTSKISDNINLKRKFAVDGKNWWSLRAAEVYLLESEDVRTVGMVRLVYPPRDISKDIPTPWDKPEETNFFKWVSIDQFFGRFDFNVGITLTEGEEETSTQSNLFYLAGGSFELHKYFDFVGGYAISDEGDGQWYVGASMDLRLFGEFIGLSSKITTLMASSGESN